MTVAIYCIIFAFILSYLPKIPVAIAMYKLDNRYDNNYPRDQQARLTGFGKRALSAHLNSFEIFPAFAAAVIVAHIVTGPSSLVDNLAVAFVLSRIVYIILYLANLAWLRSLVWAIGFFIVLAIFLSDYFH